MKRIALAVVLLVSLAASAWAGFDEGFAAYERGDYETALREWEPLAEHGLAEAQYNLGVMYSKGQGVPRDDAEAVKWYRMAAAQGYARARAVANRLDDEADAHMLWLKATSLASVSVSARFLLDLDSRYPPARSDGVIRETSGSS